MPRFIVISLVMLAPATVLGQRKTGEVTPKVYEVGKDGLVIAGKLSKDAPPLAGAPIAQLNGAPYQVFHVKLQKGQSYVIDLASKDFDAYLILQNAIGKVLAHDDDSGEDSNSQIVVTAPTNGVYRVVAAALDRKPGVFELKIRGGALSEEQKLAALATKLNDDGMRLFQQGKAAAAFEKLRQAHDIRQRLFPAAKHPDGHADLATSLNNLGLVLQVMGQAEQAFGYHGQCLEMRQKLLPTAKYPDGHTDLAQCLNNLGSVLEAMGQAEQAFGYFRRSLEMRQKLYPAAKFPDGHHDLAISLNNLGFVLTSMGQTEQALGYYRQSLEMKQKLFPAANYSDGHSSLASSLNNLGSVLNSMGQAEQALGYYRQSLEMRQKLFPAAKYPVGHPALARSLNSVGFVLQVLGQEEQALGYYVRSLEMRQKLFPAAKYPDGHLDLASSLDCLGSVLNAMGEAEQALGYYRQSLKMRQKLFPAAKYPVGHPALANSFNSMGFMLQVLGQAEQALGHYRQSLEMRQKLFPAVDYRDGHPDLAISLTNLGGVLQAIGQAEQALGYELQGLEMQQRLLRRELTTASEAAAFDKISTRPRYRDGYLTVTRTLKTDGGASLAMIWQSRSMVTRLLEQRQANARAAGTTAGAKLDELRGCRRRVEQLLQDTRRKVEDRDQLLTEYADKIDKLQRELVAEIPAQKRWQELDHLGPADLVKALPPGAVFIDFIRYTRFDYVEKKEKRTPSYVAFVVGGKADSPLAPLPKSTGRLLQHPLTPVGSNLAPNWTNPAPNGAAVNSQGRKPLEYGLELLSSPEGAAVEDERRTFAPSGLGRIGHADSRGLRPWLLTSTPSGLVSGLTGREAKPPIVPDIVRVELDDAAPIDAAVRQWRTAIDSRRDDLKAVAELQRLVWEKLAKALPAGTKTLYLAADGDLARLPWAALPVAGVVQDSDPVRKPGQDRSPIPRILLEDYAIAQAPHGLFLLDHLLHPRRYAGPESLLALGGVDYDSPEWPALPGTVAEMKSIAAIGPGLPKTASGRDATTARLSKLLPTVRYAHLATHGEFKADELTKEKKRAEQALQSRLTGDDTRKIAAKNPLGYVGVVLSEGKILSGLGIVDLPLENLKLVTLSACETGLGETTGGEGVANLQMAFHLAGCPNVVASLWKVNDAATAALMTKFYHELWVGKKPPIEALREAQLTIYRHPELIPDLAGERGAPRLQKAVVVKASEPAASAAGVRRADTKLWAAFVLSGIGR